MAARDLVCVKLQYFNFLNVENKSLVIINQIDPNFVECVVQMLKGSWPGINLFVFRFFYLKVDLHATVEYGPRWVQRTYLRL
jgi:hypothetical protein